MIFSKRTTYTLRALLHLVPLYPNGYLPVKEISKRENISKKFLDQLFSSLSKAKIVTSKKGRHGGFFLHREPSSTTLLEIVEALEGPLSVAECSSQYSRCSKKSNCKVYGMIEELHKLIRIYLSQVSLKTLSEREISGKLIEYSI